MQATNQPLIKINQRICSSNEGKVIQKEIMLVYNTNYWESKELPSQRIETLHTCETAKHTDIIGKGIGRFYRKMLHNWLPTRDKKYSDKDTTSSKFPLCDKTDETFSHLVQCGALNDKKTIENMSSQLNKCKTSPSVRNNIVSLFTRQIICDGNKEKHTLKKIREEWEKENLSMVIGLSAVDSLHKINKAQLIQRGITPMPSRIWKKKVQQIIITKVYDIWKNRNDNIHSCNGIKGSKLADLRNQGQEIFKRRSEVLLEDKFLFNRKRIQDAQKMGKKALIKWIEAGKIALHKFQVYKSKESTFQGRITHYFRT